MPWAPNSNAIERLRLITPAFAALKGDCRRIGTRPITDAMLITTPDLRSHHAWSNRARKIIEAIEVENTRHSGGIVLVDVTAEWPGGVGSGVVDEYIDWLNSFSAVATT